MVVSAANSKSNNESRGLGLFFIFFHNHPHHQFGIFNNNNNNISNTKRNTSSSSSSNLLLSKTQSTLSICGILFFTTLLLFTLSTFQPTPSVFHHHNKKITNTVTRRFLHDKGIPRNALKRFPISHLLGSGYRGSGSHFPALQGMGELYLRGTKAMSDLIVGHVSEDASIKEIRTFIRVVLHSGLLSRSDLVLLFASPNSAAEFGSLVKSECDSLLRLVQLGAQLGRGELGYGLTRYFRVVGEGGKEPLWGRKANSTSVGESTRPSYGSVVGFDASELDPENSLSGFLDQVPMTLRRWACYPMLLGRVRRNFKHMGLIDVKNFLVLSDPFTRVRNRTSESVFIWANSVVGTESTRHGRRNSGKTHINPETRNQLNSGIVVGGSRGVRRFANAALTEIVRVSIEHKGKNRNTVTESGVVNQLVHNGHLLKSRNVNLIKPTESIPDLGSLTGFDSDDPRLSYLGLSEYYSVVQRGERGVSGSLDVDYVVMTEICLSHKLVSAIYTDCFARQQR